MHPARLYRFRRRRLYGSGPRVLSVSSPPGRALEAAFKGRRSRHWAVHLTEGRAARHAPGRQTASGAAAAAAGPVAPPPASCSARGRARRARAIMGVSWGDFSYAGLCDDSRIIGNADSDVFAGNEVNVRLCALVRPPGLHHTSSVGRAVFRCRARSSVSGSVEQRKENQIATHPLKSAAAGAATTTKA